MHPLVLEKLDLMRVYTALVRRPIQVANVIRTVSVFQAIVAG